MKYVAMIYGNQAKWESFPADAWPEAIAGQDAFNKKYRDSGELLGAYGLADAANAQLVRRKDGPLELLLLTSDPGSTGGPPGRRSRARGPDTQGPPGLRRHLRSPQDHRGTP